MRRGKLLVIAMFGLCLVGCAEEEKPVEVPNEVQQGISAVLTEADPAVRPAFNGETCDTDPLADPPDDHRWRMTAKTDTTPDALLAAGVRSGWQPERADDDTLLLTNRHQFGESVTLVVGAGTVRMFVEKDCTGSEMTDADRVGQGEPELTEAQRDRLEDTVGLVTDAVADIERKLKVRPRAGVSVPERGPGGYVSCDARTSTGAAWHNSDVIVAEATRERDLAATSAALTDAVSDDWRARDWHEDVDDEGDKDITLVLESIDGRANMSVRISYWGTTESPDGVRLHISGAHTTCVPVSTP